MAKPENELEQRITNAAEGHADFGALVFSLDTLVKLIKDAELGVFEDGMNAQVELDKGLHRTAAGKCREHYARDRMQAKLEAYNDISTKGGDGETVRAYAKHMEQEALSQLRSTPEGQEVE